MFLLRMHKSMVAKRSIGAVLGVTLALALPLSSTNADARAGGGGGSGSRGFRTFSAPPATATAPRSVQPMQRTQTPAPTLGNPGLGAPAAAPRRFGFGTGLMAGMLGAGVLGMLTGHGFFGGLGGMLSMLGLLLQIAVIGGLIWLAIRFFRGRSAVPAMAGGPGNAPGAAPYARSGLGNLGGGAPARDTVEIGAEDFAAFERALIEVQTAYGLEDADRLARVATPEMLRYFGSDIADNQRRGLRNAVSDAKLLQGDLAEAWSEGTSEYATVAMRFSIVDTMVDRNTGRVVQGEIGRPTEATELWTFRREGRGAWMLSAIQQTA